MKNENTIYVTEWNKESYQSFLQFLKTQKDEKYKEFHSSLVLDSKYEMIGIRVPIMRKIAKEIAKTNIEEFLQYAQDNYYEEVMIQGLVISSIKDEEIFNKYFKEYINEIDNWALCDTFCSSIKIVEKYEDKYFKEAVKMSLNKKEFISRIGIVMILGHFVNEKNLETIFETLNQIESDKFYINMAEAWLVCEMYIHFPKETNAFLQGNNLNKFTHNKAISKIHDSYRVSKEEKEYLNTLRR
ncbi:MAG: DNA alkylation repair protein [Clostridia bacterium]|nr:DNA alkylation repair protein [Clostridia bacterium]